MSCPPTSRKTRNISFQIFLKERFQLFKWDHVHLIVSSSIIARITRHGLPTATQSAGTERVTTLPAPVTPFFSYSQRKSISIWTCSPIPPNISFKIDFLLSASAKSAASSRIGSRPVSNAISASSFCPSPSSTSPSIYFRHSAFAYKSLTYKLFFSKTKAKKAQYETNGGPHVFI